jgi:hypothetical protein
MRQRNVYFCAAYQYAPVKCAFLWRIYQYVSQKYIFRWRIWFAYGTEFQLPVEQIFVCAT